MTMTPHALTREQVEHLVRHHTIGWGPHSKVSPLLDNDAALRQALAQRTEQIDKLAAYILASVPGEPSQSEGAVDTAIRILAQQAQELAKVRLDLDVLGRLSQSQAQEVERLRVALEAVLPIAVEWCSPEEAKEVAAIKQAQAALKES